jgi:biotin transport system substrate-specific component
MYPLTALAALLVGNLTIYLFGLPWLATFVGWQAVLPLGLFPFIAGDAAKLACATGVVLLWCRNDGSHCG